MASSVSGTSSNVMRTYGLSGSGIDVDSMVEKLMTAARQPYTKLEQQQTILGWKKEAYNTLATSIDTFRNQKVFNFQMKSTLAPKTVTASNSSVVSVTATGDAVNVNHSLSVTQLAAGVTQTSSSAITTGTSKTSLATQMGVSGTFSITINGKQISVNSSQSINDLVSSINKAGAGVTATYDTTQDRFYLYSNGTGSSSAIDYSGSSTDGLNFITNKLKLSAISNVNSNGVTSGNSIAFDDTANLASQFNGLAGSFNLKLSVGGTTASIAVDTTKTSLNDIITQINNMKSSSGTQLATATLGTDGKLTIKAADDATPLTLTGSDTAAINFLNNQLNLGVTDSSLIDHTSGVQSSTAFALDQTGTKLKDQFQFLAGTFELKISDGTTTKTITVDADNDTMESFLNKINTQTGGIAVASFEHGKFSLKSADSTKTLDLSGSDTYGTTFLTQRLNLISQKGQDAQVKLDGVTMTQSTNKFTVANVTYNLLGTGTSTVSIANDIDKIISSVKTFIDDYNTLLSAVNTKVSETYDSDYQPLSDDQKKAMSDDDISAWTTKAKTGLLHNDSILKPMAEAMRSAFSSSVSGLTGKYKSAASIGIATGVDWTENGKLYVDEDTLRSALEEDPDVVYKIFGTTGTNTNENGIAVRLSNILKDASSKIVDQAGASTATTLTNDTTSVLGKQNKDLTTNMTALNKKLIAQENQYYSQFNAMEEALSKLSQQTSYLSSLLGTSS